MLTWLGCTAVQQPTPSTTSQSEASAMKSESFVKRIELKDRNGRVVGTKDVVTYGAFSKVHEAA
jgi:hypothetical protein